MKFVSLVELDLRWVDAMMFVLLYGVSEVSMKMICLAATILLIGSLQAFAYHHGAHYRSVDGSMVHVPYHTNHHMRGEMAVCRDGTHSVSHHHRGTCSHHGGVGHWG